MLLGGLIVIVDVSMFRLVLDWICFITGGGLELSLGSIITALAITLTLTLTLDWIRCMVCGVVELSLGSIMIAELSPFTLGLCLLCSMVDDGFIIGLGSRVFTNVKVPNLLTGLSPLSEPSVLLVRR